MDYKIAKGLPEDYDDIIDFGNYIFTVDFPSLLPKIYKNHTEYAQYHHIIKEGTKIKAMVCSFPLSLKVLDHDLKVYGIGTVSVHRYSRGSGYMKLLMDSAIAEMKALHCDLAVLGGQRQRYEYWGFTPCGITINLSFNQSNIKHYKLASYNDYTFIKYDESRCFDLDKAVVLHDSQAAHGLREKNSFIEISSSWENNVFFIYDKEEFSGYVCASGNNKMISEIVLKNPDDIDKIIVSYMKHFNLENMSLGLNLHRSEEFIKLSRLCEDYSINSSTNLLIMNYTKVIKAFMDLKSTFSPLSEGCLIINVKESGSYKIEVKAKIITVEETNEPHDISLSHLDASALLFSHSSFINTSYNYINPLIKSWFPLPLFYPGLDNV